MFGFFSEKIKIPPIDNESREWKQRSWSKYGTDKYGYEEYLTDLTTVLFGFGVFNANASF